MSKRVVRGFLRSDGKPDFSTSKFTKPGELEYLSQKPVYSATSRSPIIKGIDLMISRGVRRVPITDSRGTLFGIVTSMDVVNFLDVPLTTVNQSADEMGRIAGSLILDKISGKRKLDTAEEILVPTRLVIRNSCGIKGER